MPVCGGHPWADRGRSRHRAARVRCRGAGRVPTYAHLTTPRHPPAPGKGARPHRAPGATAHRATKPVPGASHASTVPSAARPVTSSRPGSATAWWWEELTTISSPSSPWASDPASKVARCSVNVPSLTRCTRSVTSGKCWVRYPPSATAMICSPRQIPRIGVPATRACRYNATSNSSRRCRGRSLVGCGSWPYIVAEMSGPPVRMSPSTLPTSSAAASCWGAAAPAPRPSESPPPGYHACSSVASVCQAAHRAGSRRRSVRSRVAWIHCPPGAAW